MLRYQAGGRLLSARQLPVTLGALRRRGWRVLGAHGGEGAVPLSELNGDGGGDVCAEGHSGRRPTVLVMGSEMSGLRTQVRRACEALVCIPASYPLGWVSGLELVETALWTNAADSTAATATTTTTTPAATAAAAAKGAQDREHGAARAADAADTSAVSARCGAPTRAVGAGGIIDSLNVGVAAGVLLQQLRGDR